MARYEDAAKRILEAQSTARLIEQFELTEVSNEPHIPTVRGWIMDELKRRDAEAFDKWIDSDEDSPKEFF